MMEGGGVWKEKKKEMNKCWKRGGGGGEGGRGGWDR